MVFRKRLLAFIIDMLIFMLIFMLFNIIPICDDYFNREFTRSDIVYQIYGISLIAVMLLFIGKDILKGKSIGKRIAKIKVVNHISSVPSILQLFIRNISVLIWPVEFALLLLDKKKLGDVWAETDVVLDRGQDKGK